MRTEQARPVRLQDYRPSDWLIDKVDLDISLHPSATRVRARLSVRPNPTASGAAPLRLDGDEISLSSIAIDGAPLAARRLCGNARQPDHRAAAARRIPTRDRNHDRSLRQHQADGALSFERHLLHAMRGRRLPPHHLFPRPPGRDGGLHHAHRSRPRRRAGAARQRQSRRGRRSAGRTAFRGLARSASEAVLSVRSGRRRSRLCGRHASPPCPAAPSRSKSMSSAARRTAAPMRWIRSSARCAGTRTRSGANTTSTFS